MSWIAVFNTKDLMGISNIQISPEESRKRAITVKIDRWTFSLIGLDLGFAIGITHYFLPEPWGSGIISTDAATFSVAVITVSVITLISHTRFDNSLESYSKDYLSFTYALGLLLIFCLPSPFSIIGFLVILIVTFLQILIVINASIEFIRFEELNPLWYMAEEAFVAGGIAIGLLGAWLSGTVFSNPWNTLFYTCACMILINIFAQSFINQGSFPSADAINIEEKAPSEKTPDEAQDTDAIRGEAWMRNVNRICKEYNLSPRQSEILKLLANGRDSIYIENYFCISKSTAKSHIYNIYRKLSIHSRQELIDIVERME